MKKLFLTGLLMLSMSMQMNATEVRNYNAEKLNYTISVGDMTNLQTKEIDVFFEALPEFEEVNDECSVTVEGTVGVVTIKVTYTASDCATAAKKAAQALKQAIKEAKRILLD